MSGLRAVLILAILVLRLQQSLKVRQRTAKSGVDIAPGGAA
jgi:hypothetical protein